MSARRTLSRLPTGLVAGFGLVLLGLGARQAPPNPIEVQELRIGPLEGDLCSGDRGSDCLVESYGVDEIVQFYGLPLEAADRLAVACDGTISFGANGEPNEAPRIDKVGGHAEKEVNCDR